MGPGGNEAIGPTVVGQDEKSTGGVEKGSTSVLRTNERLWNPLPWAAFRDRKEGVVPDSNTWKWSAFRYRMLFIIRKHDNLPN